jgi:transposase-like protein
MTELNATPAPATLVAIDISKPRHEVLIEAPGQARRRRLTILSTKADHDRLVEAFAAYGGPVLIGFEATGGYHRGLAYRLLSAGFELRLVSSVALARTREALHNGWDKNDLKDAQVILHMLRIGAAQRYVDPLAAGINDLQELSNTHEAISKAKTETWHRILTHYLSLYFPEKIEPSRDSRRLQLLTGWSHDEANAPYSPEVRERAVRMVFEHRDEYTSQYDAIRSTAAKIGCSGETLRHWVRQAERDQGLRAGPTSTEQEKIKALEREVRELRQANEILRRASAYFAQAELDRRFKP